jgi:curved DNA-binding protein CbpA
MKNYYEILQILSDAEPEVVAAAYRALALKYHPDRNSSADANSVMQLLNEAYTVLGNKTRRKEYDKRIAVSGISNIFTEKNGQTHASEAQRKESGNHKQDDELFKASPALNGLYFYRSENQVHFFRFFVDGLVLIKTEHVKVDEPLPKVKINRMFGNSYEYSGSYWLASGMLSFEAFSESGVVSYTGTIVGQEIHISSYSNLTKEKKQFVLTKLS